MAAVIDFDTERRRRRSVKGVSNLAAATVVCTHCGERHPIVKLVGGEQRCVTAFFDGANWFCRNRGCRRAWLSGCES